MSSEPEKRIVSGKSTLPAMSLKEFKFKDKAGRDRLVIKTEEVFGFLPKIIVIDKVHGKSNTIVISAIVPDEKSGKKA